VASAPALPRATSARLESHGKLLDDDFFNGEPWLVGLGRYSIGSRLPSLQLEILPMRSDAPVYLPKTGTDQLTGKEQTVQLKGVTVTPQYQLQMSGSAPKP
jgi:beta-galactosidase